MEFDYLVKGLLRVNFLPYVQGCNLFTHKFIKPVAARSPSLAIRA